MNLKINIILSLYFAFECMHLLLHNLYSVSLLSKAGDVPRYKRV